MLGRASVLEYERKNRQYSAMVSSHCSLHRCETTAHGPAPAIMRPDARFDLNGRSRNCRRERAHQIVTKLSIEVSAHIF